MDREAAKQAFGEYLKRETLTGNQIRFINQIIEYLTHNGVMDAALLYKPPFIDYASAGLDGVFADNDATDIVSILSSIREAAVA
jgi:type I restriction enzyme, R subunit